MIGHPTIRTAPGPRAQRVTRTGAEERFGLSAAGEALRAGTARAPRSIPQVALILLLHFFLALPLFAGEPKPETPKSVALPVAELKRDTPVEFEKEILPVLKNDCLACHNQTKSKAGLNLETPQSMLKGGDTGPAIVPGRSAESLLFKAAAHLDPDLLMPPKDNKANASELNPEQLALLKLWIDQGAKGEVRAAAPVNWLDAPPQLDEILAVALTRDGQFAACGRGNQIFVYHIPSAQLVARLVDPSLASVSGFTNAAHRDLVNSLAFNPDGTLLASAGFREVKLWRRSREVERFTIATGDAVESLALSPDRKWLATATADHHVALYDVATGQRLRLLAGHSNRVTSLKFAPDGARLCSGSTDKTLRVWNVNEGALAVSVETPADINAVAWLAGGKQIVSGSADGLVRIWSLRARGVEATGLAEKAPPVAPAGAALELVRELPGHQGPVTALEPLPDGQGFLSGGADATVRQWALKEGQVVRQVQDEDAITAVCVSPDGKRFASADTNGVAKLWDAEDGRLLAEMKGDRYAYERVAETERALTVAQSTVEFQKKTLETAEAESKLQTERVAKATTTNTFNEKVFLEKEKAFKEAQTAKNQAEKALDDLLAEIKKVTEAFESAEKAAKEASALAKAASDKATQTQLAAERSALSKTDAEKIALDTASVAAKTQVALSKADAAKDTAKRIAEESAAVAEKSKAFAEAVAADADIKNNLAAEAKRAAERAIEQVAALSFSAGQLKPAYDKSLAEAPEKRKVATNRIESATKSLNGAEQDFKKAETRKSVTGHELELALQAAERAANGVAKVKATLAAAVDDKRKIKGALARFNAAATESEQPIRALAFSPDCRILATYGDDRRVHTWNADTGAAFEVLGRAASVPGRGGLEAKAPEEPGAPGDEPAAAEKSGVPVLFLDAHTVLATGDPARLVAWELNPAWSFERVIGTGNIDSPLSDRVNAVRFSPDGQSLATGSGEPTRSGEIKLWSAADGALLREFKNVHSDAVLSVDFSPDGKYLASSSADRFVRVLDLASGKVVKTFEGHTSYVLGVAWKGDGRALASAGADNVIKIWDFISGERRKNIDGASKEVTSIAFVGVTDQAVAASGDSQVRLLRENGEKVRSFEGTTDFVNAAVASPDGRLVIAGGQDSVLRVWDAHDGRLVADFAPPSTR